MCEICRDLSAVDTLDRWTSIDSDWWMAPTVGYFTRGYGLMVPWAHSFSLGELGAAALQIGGQHAERVRERISELFGPAILAEHGSAGICRPGAACCDHAHLHVIPLRSEDDRDELLRAYRAIDNTKEQRIGQLADLHSVPRPYVYYSPRQGEHYVWPDADFPRQWVRMAVGRLFGHEMWDWRTFQFEAELRADRDIFRNLLPAGSPGEPHE